MQSFHLLGGEEKLQGIRKLQTQKEASGKCNYKLYFTTAFSIKRKLEKYGSSGVSSLFQNSEYSARMPSSCQCQGHQARSAAITKGYPWLLIKVSSSRNSTKLMHTWINLTNILPTSAQYPGMHFLQQQ